MKYKRFKLGSLDTEMEMEKQYKPIITAIKTHEPLTVKQEIKKEQGSFEPSRYEEFKREEENENTIISDDDAEDIFEPGVSSTPQPNKELSTVIKSMEEQEHLTGFLDEHFRYPLTREYMEKMMKDMVGKKSQIDHTYGPRFIGSTLMIGDKPLDFDENGRIQVGDVWYKPTEGLYELIFKRTPNSSDYTSDDLKAYKDILHKSNAHKKGYSYNVRINRLPTNLKYKEVISKLYPLANTVTGKGVGILSKSVSERDISYWDDPNELCDRLRLLVASAETGNSGHGNEILNIVEELREAGLIKGQGNETFRSFLQ